MRRLLIVPVLAVLAVPGRADEVPGKIGPDTKLEVQVASGETHSYALPMRAGESADVAVVQEGVDVAVELAGPDGKTVDVVDSPNGRNGDEPVQIMAVGTGDYVLRVKPLDGEPAGKYRIEVRAFRDVAATHALLTERHAARGQAANWLLRNSMGLEASGSLDPRTPPKPFDVLASQARVVGLGEATHGSREFGALRLSLTKRLVERHGFRVVALEASAARLRALAPYVAGMQPRDKATEALIENGWIGRRIHRALLQWARDWNQHHHRDPVSVIGLDAQDNAPSRATLVRFLADAYGDKFAERWKPVAAELDAADEQTTVFGDSGVSAATRAAVLEASALLAADHASLTRKFGAARVEAALDAARDLVQFADFNGGGGLINHSRDWYMAGNVMAALGAKNRIVFWAHNAHVAHTSPTSTATGALLRSMLGCGYRAVATAFGQGSFVAQLPNDPQDRLLVSRLDAAPAESIDGMLAENFDRAVLAAWDCDGPAPPAWLSTPHPLHWIGGLYTPGSIPSAAFRPYALTTAFDAVAYLPRVEAEDIPTDRPLIPARAR
ncbi:MAG TPA: erythromycin esterase family protein [Rhizomicrobium sp.]|nr:erythromycin esterase family protein [Rhizomicrobium sp.]